MSEILPSDYKETYHYNEYEIKYDNIVEMCQGGPEIGNLLINGKNCFPTNFFGGPLLIEKGMIYLPVFYRSWLSSGFKLGVINLNNFSLKLFGKKENLILIEKIDGNYLYYFIDLSRNFIAVPVPRPYLRKCQLSFLIKNKSGGKPYYVKICQVFSLYKFHWITCFLLKVNNNICRFIGCEKEH